MRLSNHSESIVRFIREELKCADIAIEYGEGNWLELEKQQCTLNEALIRFYQEINEIEKQPEKDNDVMDETECAKLALLSYYPTVTSDPYTGMTIARLTVSASAFEYIQYAVPKQGGTDEDLADLPETVRGADGFREFLSGIDLFKRLIGDEQGVFYQAVEQKALLKASEAEYSSWNPSRGIEVSSNPANAAPGANAQSGSTGFQCYFLTSDNSGNDTYHAGFVTAAHLSVIDPSAANNTANWRTNVFADGTTTKVGNILYCWYGGYLDAAFFELESSYSINTVLYYSNQSNPVNVSGGYVSPYVGQAFYKSGKTTGVTAGIVRGPDPIWTLFTAAKWIHLATDIN